MAKKKPFTKSQHKKAGAMLKKIRTQLNQFVHEVDASYSRSTSKQVFRAIESLATLASELDDLLARETTEDEWNREKLQQIYFGPKGE
jgi:hypothetical protein